MDIKRRSKVSRLRKTIESKKPESKKPESKKREAQKTTRSVSLKNAVSKQVQASSRKRAASNPQALTLRRTLNTSQLHSPSGAPNVEAQNANAVSTHTTFSGKPGALQHPNRANAASALGPQAPHTQDAERIREATKRSPAEGARVLEQTLAGDNVTPEYQAALLNDVQPELDLIGQELSNNKKNEDVVDPIMASLTSATEAVGPELAQKITDPIAANYPDSGELEQLDDSMKRSIESGKGGVFAASLTSSLHEAGKTKAANKVANELGESLDKLENEFTSKNEKAVAKEQELSELVANYGPLLSEDELQNAVTDFKERHQDVFDERDAAAENLSSALPGVGHFNDPNGPLKNVTGPGLDKVRNHSREIAESFENLSSTGAGAAAISHALKESGKKNPSFLDGINHVVKDSPQELRESVAIGITNAASAEALAIDPTSERASDELGGLAEGIGVISTQLGLAEDATSLRAGLKGIQSAALALDGDLEGAASSFNAAVGDLRKTLGEESRFADSLAGFGAITGGVSGSIGVTKALFDGDFEGSLSDARGIVNSVATRFPEGSPARARLASASAATTLVDLKGTLQESIGLIRDGAFLEASRGVLDATDASVATTTAVVKAFETHAKVSTSVQAAAVGDDAAKAAKYARWGKTLGKAGKALGGAGVALEGFFAVDAFRDGRKLDAAGHAFGLAGGALLLAATGPAGWIAGGALTAVSIGIGQYSKAKQSNRLEDPSRDFLEGAGFDAALADKFNNHDGSGNPPGPVLAAAAQKMGVSPRVLFQYLNDNLSPNEAHDLLEDFVHKVDPQDDGSFKAEDLDRLIRELPSPYSLAQYQRYQALQS